MDMKFDESRLDTQPGGALKGIAKAFSILSGRQAKSGFVGRMGKSGGVTPLEKVTQDQADTEAKVETASELAALKKKRDAAYSDLKTKRRVLTTESGRIARSAAASADRKAEYADKAKTDVKKARSLARIKANTAAAKKPAAKPRRTTK
jgi:hypothetical protein